MKQGLKPGIDYTLFITCVILMLFGILMVYDASSAFASETTGDSAYYFKRQIVWAALGIIAGFYFYKRDFRQLDKMIVPGMIAAIVLLFAVHVPGLGRRIGGAKRWLHLGPLSFQPFELAKIFYVLYLSKIFTDDTGPLSRKIIRSAAVTGIVALGLIFQKDLGGTAIIMVLYFAMLLLAGVPVWFFGGALAAAVGLVVLLIKVEPYRMQRMLSFTDPWKDFYGSGWQIAQSLISVGSGGIFGVGFSNSQQKFLYLPTPHTDYIFSIIGEELGLWGAVLVIFGFFMILSRGVFIAINVKDRFYKFMATGLTLAILTQAIINIGVAIGIMPSKGTTLPFISAGGSSLLITCIAAGLLLSASREAYGGRP
jgi:cell division protein FtsW